MKARIFQNCSLALLLALGMFSGGCDQEQAHSATVPAATDVSTNQPPPDASAEATDTNQPDSEVADQMASDQDLANAPGKIISTPEVSTTNATNNPRLNDFVKLVQAGMGESVLIAYVTNSPTAFNLSSDDILYLNDLGAPETVMTAMLQRDQHFNSNSTAPAQTQSAYTYTNPAPAPEPPMEAPYPDQNAMAQAPENVPPLTPSPEIEDDVQQAPNASYSYFYDSLAPYGNWVDVQGYGACWRPTAGACNPGWQPYCDRGHWAYTDCGWCWVSDYSWGWAPFHYGRWFQHSRFGWCWAPDTVWGPSWVSWRYSNSHCGWAPLPPSACFRPEFGFTYFGRSVGFNFGFGLSADRFTFVSLDHFHDRFPGRYRLPHREVTKIFNTTSAHTQIIRGNNNTLINRGIPVDRVAAASHTQIHPIHVRTDSTGPRSSQLGRDGHSLSIYRPALPTPKPSVHQKMVGEGVQRDTHFDLRSRVNRAPAPAAHAPAIMPSGTQHRPIISNPNSVTPAMNQGRDNRFPNPGGGEKPNSLIMRGPNHTTPSRNDRDDNSGQNTPGNLRHGPVFQPQTPAQPTLPAENNHKPFVPPTPAQPALQPQNPLPPTLNRPGNGNGNDSRGGNGLLPQPQRQQRPPQIQQQQRILQPQQQQQIQQQRTLPTPRQEAPPRVFDSPRGTPRMNDQNSSPGFRSEPVIRSQPAPPRIFESRPAPEVRVAPSQPSGPARGQDNSPGKGGGNSGGGGIGNGNSNGNGNGNGNGGGNGGGGRGGGSGHR